MRKWAVRLLAVLLQIHTAAASTYYVDGLNGNDAHTGLSVALAVKTLYHAQSLSASDTSNPTVICVMNTANYPAYSMDYAGSTSILGTFANNNVLEGCDKNGNVITFGADGFTPSAPRPIISGGSSVAAFQIQNWNAAGTNGDYTVTRLAPVYWRFTGLEFQGTNTVGKTGNTSSSGVYVARSSDMTFDHDLFDFAGGSGFQTEAADNISMSYNVVNGNARFVGTSSPPVQYSCVYGSGISFLRNFDWHGDSGVPSSHVSSGYKINILFNRLFDNWNDASTNPGCVPSDGSNLIWDRQDGSCELFGCPTNNPGAYLPSYSGSIVSASGTSVTVSGTGLSSNPGLGTSIVGAKAQIPGNGDEFAASGTGIASGSVVTTSTSSGGNVILTLSKSTSGASGTITLTDTKNHQALPAYLGKTLIARNLSYGSGARGFHFYKDASPIDVLSNTLYNNDRQVVDSTGKTVSEDGVYQPGSINVNAFIGTASGAVVRIMNNNISAIGAPSGITWSESNGTTSSGNNGPRYCIADTAHGSSNGVVVQNNNCYDVAAAAAGLATTSWHAFYEDNNGASPTYSGTTFVNPQFEAASNLLTANLQMTTKSSTLLAATASAGTFTTPDILNCAVASPIGIGAYQYAYNTGTCGSTIVTPVVPPSQPVQPALQPNNYFSNYGGPADPNAGTVFMFTQ